MKINHRILLIADLSGYSDEGIRNIGEKIFENLVRNHEVLAIKPKNILDLIRIIKFNPDIIHSLRGPSFYTFILLKILQYLTGCKKIYSSILHPSKNMIKHRRCLQLFNSIKLFTQDEVVEKKFQNANFVTIPIPNGIDQSKYNYNLNPDMPLEIKRQINENKKYLLHVGHLKSSRGLNIVIDILNSTNWGVIIIISERYNIENKIYNDLIKAGAIIYIGYIENLGGIYSYVDSYLFPIEDPYGSIDFPLTVLESIACGTPVLCKPYKALPRFLNKNDGVFFYNSKNDLFENLNKINKYKLKNFNYDFTWGKIVEKIENQYFS